MTQRNLNETITEQWESGEYGRSDACVALAPEVESPQLDSDLAMKLISIRLPIPLIEALKAIAAHHGMAYQPMIRDLLTRFARSEYKQIVAEYQQHAADIDQKMQEAKALEEASPPVQAFMDRMRA